MKKGEKLNKIKEAITILLGQMAIAKEAGQVFSTGVDVSEFQGKAPSEYPPHELIPG
jgi:hypothetical protein